MKVLSIFTVLLFISACSSPAPSKQAPPPHSTDRSDQAYEELDKEMNK